MGSVAEELFRSLPCPVLTVGPNISSRFDNQSEIKQILFSDGPFPGVGCGVSISRRCDSRVRGLHHAFTRCPVGRSETPGRHGST